MFHLKLLNILFTPRLVTAPSQSLLNKHKYNISPRTRNIGASDTMSLLVGAVAIPLFYWQGRQSGNLANTMVNNVDMAFAILSSIYSRRTWVWTPVMLITKSREQDMLWCSGWLVWWHGPESHLGHILIICSSISRQRPNNEQSAYTGYIEIHYTHNNNNIVPERTAPHHPHVEI